MRTSQQRLVSIASGTALAALLGACAAPMPPAPVAGSYPGQYPNTTTAYPSQYPATSGYPATTAAVEYGRVTDIQTVSMGATSATNPRVRNAVVGGVIGAVVGNIIGKNVDNGHSRSGATVLGGAAGAAIGSQAGRNQPDTASSGSGGPAYRVVVQTDGGASRIYEVGATGDLRVGDRVRVENGVIYRS